jgi:hypothetical protein
VQGNSQKKRREEIRWKSPGCNVEVQGRRYSRLTFYFRCSPTYAAAILSMAPRLPGPPGRERERKDGWDNSNRNKSKRNRLEEKRRERERS